jgi:hypothetical protein
LALFRLVLLQERLLSFQLPTSDFGSTATGVGVYLSMISKSKEHQERLYLCYQVKQAPATFTARLRNSQPGFAISRRCSALIPQCIYQGNQTLPDKPSNESLHTKHERHRKLSACSTSFLSSVTYKLPNIVYSVVFQKLLELQRNAWRYFSCRGPWLTSTGSAVVTTMDELPSPRTAGVPHSVDLKQTVREVRLALDTVACQGKVAACCCLHALHMHLT